MDTDTKLALFFALLVLLVYLLSLPTLLRGSGLPAISRAWLTDLTSNVTKTLLRKAPDLSTTFGTVPISSPGPSYPPLHVAIIGSGIGGSSAAHFLRQKFGAGSPDLRISVFEHKNYTGGRTQSVNITANLSVPAGAANFLVVNRNLLDLVELTELTAFEPHAEMRMGVWTGKDFAFRSASNKVLTVAKLWWKYGFGSLWRMHLLVSRMAKRFSRIYDIVHFPENNGGPFTSIGELLLRIGLHEASQHTAADLWRLNDISLEVANEVIAAINRNHFPLSADSVNGILGAGSIKAAEGQIFSVREGMDTLCERLLEMADAEVHLETSIGAIRLVETQKGTLFQLYRRMGVEGSDLAAISTLFNAVFIATPLVSSTGDTGDHSISLPPEVEPFHPAASFVKEGFQKVHVTIVVGCLRPLHFGLLDDSPRDIPEIILTTAQVDKFLSIRTIDPNTKPCPTYKIFSLHRLNDTDLHAMFTKTFHLYRRSWLAYPIMKPMNTYPPYIVLPRLYYLNAMEFVVSTMETQTIAAQNAVNVLAEAVRLPVGKVREEENLRGKGGQQPSLQFSQRSSSRSEL